MKWRLVQFSAVVVGQSHNPTVLNPDFLHDQGIVPKSWGWKVAETLTTPPLAAVRYENGVAIIVEQNKLQVTDPNVEAGPQKSKVTAIASAYVTVLPHVRYIAVGNNFQSVRQVPNATEEIQRRFLKDGPWTSSPGELEAGGIKLSYELKPVGRLNLTLDAMEAKLPDAAEEQPVLVANANFNRECKKKKATHEAVVSYLEKAMSDWKMFEQAINSMFKIGNE